LQCSLFLEKEEIIDAINTQYTSLFKHSELKPVQPCKMSNLILNSKTITWKDMKNGISIFATNQENEYLLAKNHDGELYLPDKQKWSKDAQYLGLLQDGNVLEIELMFNHDIAKKLTIYYANYCQFRLLDKKYYILQDRGKNSELPAKIQRISKKIIVEIQESYTMKDGVLFDKSLPGSKHSNMQVLFHNLEDYFPIVASVGRHGIKQGSFFVLLRNRHANVGSLPTKKNWNIMAFTPSKNDPENRITPPLVFEKRELIFDNHSQMIYLIDMDDNNFNTDLVKTYQFYGNHSGVDDDGKRIIEKLLQRYNQNADSIGNAVTHDIFLSLANYNLIKSLQCSL
jgi:hypothetical protein